MCGIWTAMRFEPATFNLQMPPSNRLDRRRLTNHQWDGQKNTFLFWTNQEWSKGGEFKMFRCQSTDISPTSDQLHRDGAGSVKWGQNHSAYQRSLIVHRLTKRNKNRSYPYIGRGSDKPTMVRSNLRQIECTSTSQICNPTSTWMFVDN